MITIDRLDQLPLIVDQPLRHWIQERLRACLTDEIAVRFYLLTPTDSLMACCWEACWGREPTAADRLEDLWAVVEYVEQSPGFYALVIPVHHEAGVVIVIPTTSPLDDTVREYLQHTAVSLC